jgi:thiamine pyrophosphate-dependent acetolactate synthase large subunit-like protein
MFEAKGMFEVFQNYRGDAVVIPTGTAGRHWRDVSSKVKRDAPLGGAMGQTTSLALGLALAQPQTKVVLFDSEGSLLMNLGILATIAGKQPKNFYHFLMDNEVYATTGGQPVPASKKVNYAGMAKATGYPSTHSFEELEDFAGNVEAILNKPGPAFIAMKITPEIENEPIGRRVRVPGRSRGEIIRDLREDLGVAVD